MTVQGHSFIDSFLCQTWSIWYEKRRQKWSLSLDYVKYSRGKKNMKRAPQRSMKLWLGTPWRKEDRLWIFKVPATPDHQCWPLAIQFIPLTSHHLLDDIWDHPGYKHKDTPLGVLPFWRKPGGRDPHVFKLRKETDLSSSLCLNHAKPQC